ncbi:Ras-like protein Rab-11B [Saprolegnia diclina VS20]|uniref:Ras-like protein Rab-11B n=1 Tax=Saprolegnia diclina (strain VS20) TaxID=1156394 RepID=T0R748_SAPDV|nr:Ras-like protein Rab-11B [Saprolegnia diclina VS20]EQC42280.1 Ras-like protein Rab-11B [Saprolegnia diclina VS20]|eukprot:XP_008603703.1 Ras-like protein Rab-11B [Saprolegnia diclina VS20]
MGWSRSGRIIEFGRAMAEGGRATSPPPPPAAMAHTSSSMSDVSSAAGEQEYVLKVVLIGDSGVGKSNLVQRFTKNKYNEASTQTIGFEFAAKTIRVGDRRIKAQIWDTAGQERFQSLTAAYYRNAVGALIVYDITNRASFEHVTHWLAQIHEHAHENVVLILVGNKCDLAHRPNTRQVSTLEAARFAETHHMEFVEASALDSTNVVEAFKRIIVPVGRLLMPTNTNSTPRLPPGWRRVLSRTRPGEYSYENQYTKERLAFAPKEAAKPSQYSFQHAARSASSGGSNKSLQGPAGVTVTKEALERQHQKAFLAQQSASPNCTSLFSGACCTIL